MIGRKDSGVVVVLLVLAVVGPGCPKDSGGSIPRQQQDDGLENRLREMISTNEIILIGRISEVERPLETEVGRRPLVLVTMEVLRYLKGGGEKPTEEAELRHVSRHCSPPSARDNEYSVYFFKGRTAGGRLWSEDIHAWSWQGWRDAEDAMFRSDKKTRFEGMPPPPETDDPISVSIAMDGGAGRELRSFVAAHYGCLDLLVQFENHSDRSLTVMPEVDGSRSHRSYPHYDLEVVEGAGDPRPVHPGAGFCGNVNPWRRRDFVSLDPGEVFRTRMTIWWLVGRVTGKEIRLRLKYTAKRDLSKRGIVLGEHEPVEDLVRSVWEGEIYSNWTTIGMKKEER